MMAGQLQDVKVTSGLFCSGVYLQLPPSMPLPSRMVPVYCVVALFLQPQHKRFTVRKSLHRPKEERKTRAHLPAFGDLLGDPDYVSARGAEVVLLYCKLEGLVSGVASDGVARLLVVRDAGVLPVGGAEEGALLRLVGDVEAQVVPGWRVARLGVVEGKVGGLQVRDLPDVRGGLGEHEGEEREEGGLG